MPQHLFFDPVLHPYVETKFWARAPSHEPDRELITVPGPDYLVDEANTPKELALGFWILRMERLVTGYSCVISCLPHAEARHV